MKHSLMDQKLVLIERSNSQLYRKVIQWQKPSALGLEKKTQTQSAHTFLHKHSCDHPQVRVLSIIFYFRVEIDVLPNRNGIHAKNLLKS